VKNSHPRVIASKKKNFTDIYPLSKGHTVDCRPKGGYGFFGVSDAILRVCIMNCKNSVEDEFSVIALHDEEKLDRLFCHDLQ